MRRGPMQARQFAPENDARGRHGHPGLARALVASAALATLATLGPLMSGCAGSGQASAPAAPPPAPREATESGAPVELAPATAEAAPSSPATGPAPRDAKAAARYSAGYGARVAQAVRANIIFPATLVSRVKHPCEVDVSTAPDGRIVGFSVTTSSGTREWDDAVKRGLMRTRTLPLDVDGRVPADLVLKFAPR